MSEALSRPQAIKKISEMIKDIRIAMLSTVTADGAIHSRPMATQQAEFQGELRGHGAITPSAIIAIRNNHLISETWPAASSHRFSRRSPGKSFFSVWGTKGV